MSKFFLQMIWGCCVQKRNETILKIGHHAKAIAHAKSSLWVKNSNSKKHVRIVSTNDLELFFAKNRKTAPKNTKYSRNETILKIGHHAKAIAHAKSSLWVKNSNSKKHVKIVSTNDLELFFAKNRKTALKNTKYSRNETILKIGHHAKAIAHAKSSLWVKN